jgi:YndJ-like protein
VVAGLGLALVDRMLGEAAPVPLAWARRLHPLGAAAAVASLALSAGGVAGGLAMWWFAVCLCATVAGAQLAWRRLSVGCPRDARSELPLVVTTIAVGLAYLSVGGAWLVISRLGWRPLDLSTDIVRLTAVHFHYAGFGLSVLAAAGLASADWLASRVALVIGSVAAIVGPPLVAAGFTFDAAVTQIGGAVAMTVAAWAVAFGTFLLATSTTGPARGRGIAPGVARSLLVVSSLSPVVPMVLAVQWALAQHVDVPALSVHDMAATHGVINGIGFVIAGLTGWLLTGATMSALSADASGVR